MLHRGLNDFQRFAVGHAGIAAELAVYAYLLEHAIDLRAGTMHQHQTHTQADQQCQVVHQIAEVLVLDPFTGNGNHQGSPAQIIDIGRGMTKPVQGGVIGVHDGNASAVALVIGSIYRTFCGIGRQHME